MDPAKRRAIEACGTCGQPEDTHQFRTGTDASELELFAALGGPCPKFAASDAAVITQKYLAITDNRAPARQPGTGRIGKRLPLHSACGHRHQPGSCPLGAVPPADPKAATDRGAARARQALGLTRKDDAEEAS